MKQILRIIFCILSCLCIASAIFLWIYVGIWWFLLAVVLALVFAGLMLLCKEGNPFKKEPPKPDYMNSDEENEEIRNNRK